MSETFCKGCGKPLEAGSEFCSKCGRPVTSLSSSGGSKAMSGKVGGIDKRYLFGIAVILLVILVPVFPRDKIIYVSGQTTTTEMYQSTSFQTSLQAYPTTSQKTIQVYTGTIQYVQSQYYSYYSSYYTACYRGYYGYIRCGYSAWPNYNTYTNTVTINPSDNVVQVSDTQSGYLSTVTLTKADGSVMTYTNVFNDNLAQSGSTTVTVTVTATSTLTQTTMVPATTVTSVACDNCIPQHVTEHVSLLQLLFGL